MALNEFIEKIGNKGLVWQNRFEVFISGPGGDASRDINLLAESVSMPGQNIRTTEDGLRYGPERDHAQAFTYGDISMTFMCTPGMPEKLYFENWQKLIVNKGANQWTANFYKDYIGQIKIHQLDRADGKNYTVTVYEAFPKTINAQEFSLISTDAHQTVSIDFAYRWWDSKSGSAPADKSWPGVNTSQTTVKAPAAGPQPTFNFGSGSGGASGDAGNPGPGTGTIPDYPGTAFN